VPRGHKPRGTGSETSSIFFSSGGLLKLLMKLSWAPLVRGQRPLWQNVQI